MAAYQAVPVAAQHNLYPCHVYLYQCRASPLPCLEHYQAYWAACSAHVFEKACHAALRSIKRERDYVCRHFVFDMYACGTPEFKIMLDAQPCVAFPVCHAGKIFVGGHCLRYHHCAVSGNKALDTTTVASNATDRVVIDVEPAVSFGVFGGKRLGSPYGVFHGKCEIADCAKLSLWPMAVGIKNEANITVRATTVACTVMRKSRECF